MIYPETKRTSIARENLNVGRGQVHGEGSHGEGEESLTQERARLPQTPCLLNLAPLGLSSLAPGGGQRRALGRDYFHIPPLLQ